MKPLVAAMVLAVLGGWLALCVGVAVLRAAWETP